MTSVAERTSMIEAAPEDVGMSSKKLENVTRVVQSYIDTGKYAGAISIVGRRGKVVHFETYGNRDNEARAPMTADTIFRMHSMTKPIASIALMTLYEEGRFQLDDPLSKYIPAFKNTKVFVEGTKQDPKVRDPEREISVRDVLMHTAGFAGADDTVPGQLFRHEGLAHIRGDGKLKGEWTLADMAEKLARVPLAFDPGTRWFYGISTDLVAYLAEVISGVPFDQFLKQRVLDPLGMTETGYVVPESKIDRLSACYRRGAENEPSLVLIDPPGDSYYTKPKTYFAGCGGLASTAHDYLRFTKMLANGGELDGTRIIGPRTLQYMATNHLPGNQDLTAMGFGPSETKRDGVGFGLGFAVLLDPTVSQVLGVPGEFYWGGAASTAFWVTPAEDLFVIFLTQLMPSNSYAIRNDLRVTTYQAIID